MFTPKSTEDLEKFMATIMTENLEQPIRIWTDYERSNKTHFWSKTVKNWWTDLSKNQNQETLSIFKDTVTFNGYRKLKNFSHHNQGCCVCVTKIEFKQLLKWLSFCLVVSFIFASVGIIYRMLPHKKRFCGMIPK